MLEVERSHSKLAATVMDESIKQNAMIAFLVFNVTVIGYQVVLNSNPFSYGRLFLGLGIGAVAAGIAYGVAYVMSQR